jgi:hypothetical protein
MKWKCISLCPQQYRVSVNFVKHTVRTARASSICIWRSLVWVGWRTETLWPWPINCSIWATLSHLAICTYVTVPSPAVATRRDADNPMHSAVSLAATYVNSPKFTTFKSPHRLPAPLFTPVPLLPFALSSCTDPQMRTPVTANTSLHNQRQFHQVYTCIWPTV